MVPSEQIFGKIKSNVNPVKLNTSNATDSSKSTSSHFGKTPMFAKPTPNVVKHNGNSIVQQPSKQVDKGKRPLDNDGFMTVYTRKLPLNLKPNPPLLQGMQVLI